MKLLSSLMTSGGGMLCLQLGSGKIVVHVIFAKDQLAGVLAEHVAVMAEADATSITDAVKASIMPIRASTQALRIEGACTRMLSQMVQHAVAPREIFAFITQARACVLTLDIFGSPGQGEGLICYVDDKMVHHISAFYSLQQIELLAGSMSWHAPRERKRMMLVVKDSALSRHATRKQLTVSGEVAAWLNGGWWLDAQRRLEKRRKN